MCGISGIYYSDQGRSIEPQLLDKITDVMFHRGPDGRGTYIDRNLGLGHRRLSIIDIEGGKQPMSDNAGLVWIAFNGEIYNFKDLKQDLLQKGYLFKTESDTEVIINSYLEYGEKCIQEFNGMFAFAIWDKRIQKLFIARDRLGIKPCYYYQDNEKFVFASEIKAILEHPDIEKIPDINSIVEYMSLRYTLDENTLFRNIKELLPGNFLTISDSNIQIHKYWELSKDKKNNIIYNDILDQCESLFNDSVKKRMISDVPIGAFLSGGLDSSAIVSVMSGQNNKIKTISVGFDEGKEYNEFEYAQLIAQQFKTDHHELVLESKDYLSVIRKLIWHRDGPLEVKNEIAIYYMSKELKKYFTVVLSGEGADELFIGYPKYFNSTKKLNLIKKLSGLSFIFTNRLMSFILDFMKRGETGRRILNGASTKDEVENLYLANLVQHRDYSIFNDPLKETAHQMEEKLIQYFSNLNGMGFHDKFLYFDANHHLQSLLMRIDRMTMANSVEARVPFLDHRLFEFISALPYTIKYNKKKKISKILLKELFSDKLPESVVWRKKMGFPVPIKNWLKDQNFQKEIRSIILNEKSRSRGYFNFPNIEALFNDFSRNEELLWRLFNLELWHKTFID